MASIRRRRWRTASGEQRESFQVDFTDQHGKRHQHSFARRKDADTWLLEQRGRVAAGTFTSDSASKTLGVAIDLWLDRAQAEQLEAGTLQQYRQLAAHVRALMSDNPKLARITQARVEQFRDDALKAHSRAMARKVLGALKSVLKDAKRRGLVAQNVATETVIGANGRHRKRLEVGVDVPTPAEVRTLLEAADPKGRAMVALAALAGLRASELRALRWSDVQLGAHPTVTVAQRADRWAAVGSPKSATSRRTVPLGETAAKALKEWRLAQPHGRALVFGTASDKPDMLGNLQRRLLTPLCVAARVPRYSWHALRHYAVSAWLASRIDPKTVQHWAGHSTLMLTLDTYGHMIPRPDDHQRIAVAEMALLG
jgi:integrase